MHTRTRSKNSFGKKIQRNFKSTSRWVLTLLQSIIPSSIVVNNFLRQFFISFSSVYKVKKAEFSILALAFLSLLKLIRKKASVFILFFTALFYVQAANADEIFPFTKLTCISELNYFDASVVEINSGSDEESDFMMEKQKELQEKYQWIGEGISDVQECKLKDSNIKIQIKYPNLDEIGIHGFCGGKPPAVLKLWEGDQLIVYLKNFNDCSVGSNYSIKSVNVKISKDTLSRNKKDRLIIVGFDVQASDRLNPNFPYSESYKRVGWQISKNNKNFFPIKDKFLSQALTNKN